MYNRRFLYQTFLITKICITKVFNLKNCITKISNGKNIYNKRRYLLLRCLMNFWSSIRSLLTAIPGFVCHLLYIFVEETFHWSNLNTRHKQSIPFSLCAFSLRYNSMTLRYNSMTLRFNSMTLRFNSMTLRFNSMALQFNSMTLRYNSMTLRFNFMTLRLNSMTVRQKELTFILFLTVSA